MSLALHEDKHDVARQQHGVTTAGAVIAYYRFTCICVHENLELHLRKLSFETVKSKLFELYNLVLSSGMEC